MNRKDASAEATEVEVAEAAVTGAVEVTEAVEAATVTDAAATMKEEDTKNNRL
jgi:hypothetical protein